MVIQTLDCQYICTIVKITRLAVTGYKNLVDCEIHPGNVHAITGCNGTGKSNLLEVLPFVIGLHAGSDETRARILAEGTSPNGDWFPISRSKEKLRAFKFCMECVLVIEKAPYVIEYALELKPTGTKERPYNQFDGATFGKERITGKKLRSPGKAKILLERNASGEVTIYGGETPRSKYEFKCKSDMSALQALEVRAADDFSKTYLHLAVFRQAFLATSLVRLNTETFRHKMYKANRTGFSEIPPGAIISAYDPYSLLKQIEDNETNWAEFCHWLKRLVNLDGICLFEEEKKKDSPLTEDAAQFIFPRQHGRLLLMGELSMGGSVVIAILTSLYTLLRKGGAALFEEPENYLHPKATVDLIRLFREFADEHSVIFSTHSPVALNSMAAEEVTVMKYLDDEFVTTTSVSEIKEAVDALDRGILTIGDLLQTDYTTE